MAGLVRSSRPQGQVPVSSPKLQVSGLKGLPILLFGHTLEWVAVSTVTR